MVSSYSPLQGYSPPYCSLLFILARRNVSKNGGPYAKILHSAGLCAFRIFSNALPSPVLYACSALLSALYISATLPLQFFLSLLLFCTFRHLFCAALLHSAGLCALLWENLNHEEGCNHSKNINSRKHYQHGNINLWDNSG